jgi:RNA polymerase sigma-70 factor (ECF subfamily)
MTLESTAPQMNDVLEKIYRTESRRILATLIRLLNDFDLAEDALQDAFRVAAEKWPEAGIPTNPRAWLVSTGRFKAIDKLRRRSRFQTKMTELVDLDKQTADLTLSDNEIEDDRLRLIFTCCHPALALEARLALTLREVCGLTTEAIAHAFLTKPTTLAQRIVRAKNKIRDAGIPYKVPSPAELSERLDGVLQVIYLVFNEGYSASTGEELTRPDLSGEAIRLGRLLVELLPEAEAMGLLALMLLHESRRATRTSPEGEIVLLEEQERSQWNQAQIAEGVALVERALTAEQFGMYTLQAAVAATHATATNFAATNWAQIVELYDVMLRAAPSPVVELNRAVAVAMRDDPRAGLQLLEDILARGELTNYHLTYAVQADLYRQLNQIDEARAAYNKALTLVQQEPERRFLERRLRELKDSTLE